MSGRKEFRTDLVFNGKVSPTMKQASSRVCGYLKTITGTMLATAGIASIGMAFNTVKDKVMECVDAGKAQVEAETNIRTAKELILTQNYKNDLTLDNECTYIFSTEKGRVDIFRTL